ncbi:MAG: hypothetical protein LBJ95_02410 [Oscillospiraceae bacterium]|nr:hypothetical protein [Oscillospiraceae bacterium]
MHKNTIKKLKTYSLTFIFCFFISFMMSLFLIYPPKEYSANEKRVLQPLPKFTLENFLNGSLVKDFEKYLSDNFAWRDFFVGMDAYCNLAIGKNGSNGIYKGKDGYLIRKPVEENMQNISQNMDKLAEFAEKTGSNLDLIIIPSTGFTMQDKLPMLHEQFTDDVILKEVKKMKSQKINLIDLRDAFFNNKGVDQIYYKTDHHLTSKGTYLVYLEHCMKKSITPIPIKRFSVENHENFFGTAYSKSALWFAKPDIIQIFEMADSPKFEVTISDSDDKSKTANTLFFKEHLNKDDKYPVFLDGNHSFVKIINPNLNEGKLLLIKDSFGQCLAPFLANHYREIDMVDPRYYKHHISDLLEKGHSQDVLLVYGLEDFVTDLSLHRLK